MRNRKDLTGADGPEDALRLIVRAYQDKVVRLISLFVRDRQECEELSSDVFLTLWGNREKLSSVSNLDSYIFIIARNKALDHLRKSKLSTVGLEGAVIDLFHNTKTTPESIYIDREMSEKLNRAIESLPGQTKLAFMLVRENKMKYREAAEVLGVSAKTVEKQVASAVAKLKQTLTE